VNPEPQLLLIGAVAAVGVLHAIVPDHWLPITVVARQRGWSKGEIAHAALQAGTGHVLSTLAFAVVVWAGGAMLAARVGVLINTLSSIALVAFGLWFAISAWRQLGHEAQGRRHSHPHGHEAFHAESKVARHAPDKRERNSRTGLLLTLGSSPMVEGIPAFFAASKYGVGLIAVMAAVFAVSAIATYVLLCVYSTAGLQQLRFNAFERFGEVLSGGAITSVGFLFWLWP
jgi:ABC-type nickel/cobalt efflux system permease component RcnA